MDQKIKAEGAERGYDFSRSTSSLKRFKFGARDSNAITVDISLANLFQRLTVECSGILANPQWKHFRHMELMKTDQIRLSNGIWRSWHMQFQKGLKPLFCSFDIDPKQDEMSHNQPQAIVLEGKYWKRTDAAVALEYRKWRLYRKQKTNWPSIRRFPTVPAVPTSSKQSEPQPMQAECSEFRLSQIFQAIDDFPESLFMDVPRPGDERSYMRPLVDTAEIIQQPYLGMLNPHIDEMVFEPMEVMFPSLVLPGRLGGNNMSPAAAVASFTSQQTSIDQSDNRSMQQMQAYPNTMQFENQPNPYVNIPPRDGSYSQGQQLPYNMNPTSFLSMPVDPRVRPPADVMDLGSPPVESMMKPDIIGSKLYDSGQTTPTTPYQQQTAQPYSQPVRGSVGNPSDKIGSLLNQFIGDSPVIGGSSSSSSHQSQADPTTPSTYSFPPDHSQQSPLPVLSEQSFGPMQQGGFDGKLTDKLAGKTELEMQLIAQQMKQLEEEHLRHLRELEQQQQIASRQYLELLQEYLNKSGCQLPTQEQHQVLMSVLSDPTSLNILKAIFKDDSLSQSNDITIPTISPQATVKEEQNASQQQQQQQQQQGAELQSYSTQTPRPTGLPMTPTPLSLNMETALMDRDKEVGAVSEFQTRLIMAAAAQATLTSAEGMIPSSYVQPKQGSVSSSFPLLTSPLGSGVETDTPPSPALMKKFKNARNLTPEEKRVYQELRRQSHITAEQRRRGSIKNGFDHLQSLVINPASFPSGKISKATILEKTIEYIQHQHHERENREKRIQSLKDEMKGLNEAIVACQEKLPASGAPVTRQRFEENRQLFKEYIRQRTQHNYKFWIYSIIIQQLFESYNSMVSTASTDELRKTVLSWFEQSCGLPSLRPIVMSSLRELSMKTSILSDPSKVPDQLSGGPSSSTS